jgi:His/Glu/Gln/Arg/opine family amino acid ABC transporter permease subunit
MDLTPFINGGIVTLNITVGSWLVSIVAGLVIVALRELGFTPLDRVISFFVTCIRATPELVMLYIVYFGIAYVGVRLQSLPAAIVALGISEAAFTSEYFRAAIMTISQRQRLAAESLGMSPMKAFRWVVLPQAVPFAIPPMVNCFVGLLKTATLAAAVGAPEILYQAEDQFNRSGRILEVTVVVVLIYVVCTIPLTLLASHLEVRARRRLGA